MYEIVPLLVVVPLANSPSKCRFLSFFFFGTSPPTPQARNCFRNYWVLKVVTSKLLLSRRLKRAHSQRDPAAPPPACEQLSQPGAWGQGLSTGLKPDHTQPSHPRQSCFCVSWSLPALRTWRPMIIQLYFIFELRKMTSLADFKNKVSSCSLSNLSESQTAPFRSAHPKESPLAPWAG